MFKKDAKQNIIIVYYCGLFTRTKNRYTCMILIVKICFLCLVLPRLKIQTVISYFPLVQTSPTVPMKRTFDERAYPCSPGVHETKLKYIIQLDVTTARRVLPWHKTISSYILYATMYLLVKITLQYNSLLLSIITSYYWLGTVALLIRADVCEFLCIMNSLRYLRIKNIICFYFSRTTGDVSNHYKEFFFRSYQPMSTCTLLTASIIVCRGNELMLIFNTVEKFSMD